MMKNKMVLILCIFFLMSALTSCGGGTPAAQPTTPPPMSAPNAVISLLSPSSVVAGSHPFSLVVTGKNFAAVRKFPDQGSYQVIFNGHQLITHTNSDTQLTAIVPAEEITVSGAITVLAETTDFISNALTFNIVPPAVLSVSPSTDSMGPNGVRQFESNFSGTHPPVTWSVREGSVGGNITSNGLYTAPKNIGTFHIVATSVADPTQSGVATVSVLNSGFIETGSMNSARSGHTAMLLADGKVLIADGGVPGTEVFDPSTGKFTAAGDMPQASGGSTATLLANGKVLVTGGLGTVAGSGGFLPILTTADLYDPSTGAFTATGSMNFPRRLHTATLLNDGRVLIAGGIDSSDGGGAATNSAELYDPATGSFELTGGMDSGRVGHTATLLDSGKVLIVGGWNGHRADSIDDPPWDPLFAELFDPASGKFEQSGTMSTTRIGHGAVRLADGKVLVLGGVPSVQNIHTELPDPQYAEVYDPATGTFVSAGNLNLSSRKDFSATLLKNGSVLIVGGELADVALTWADLFDPSTGTLTDTGGLITARFGHTATLLNDGRVLVTGGLDTNGNALASAELYQ